MEGLALARRLGDELLVDVGVRGPAHIDPIETAKHLGIEVTFGHLRGATARIFRHGSKARIRVSTEIVTMGRRRFSIMHEIGHYLLNHALPTEGDEASWFATCCAQRKRSEEREADVLAVAHLTPTRMVRPYCDVTPVNLHAVRTIADVFVTSPVMSAMRFVELSNERCAAVYSERGLVKWAKRSRTFPAYIAQGTQVARDTVAGHYFDRDVISDVAQCRTDVTTFAVLPPAIETVVVPEKLGPTQIARAVECRLAGVLPASLSSDERLPPDPRALLGTTLHRLVQDARQGRVSARTDGDLRKALADHLQKLLGAREAELLKGRLAHFVPLRSTVTFSEFLDRTTRALARAQEVYRPEAPRTDGAVSGMKPGLDGVEVKLESDTLKLTGSLDACQETADEVVIRDLKTGNVRDANGIAPHVSLQLGLYALMAQELRPGKRIRLLVDHASSDELPWGMKEESAAREMLASVRADLKPGPATAVTLAKPGGACRWCEARHVCPGYRGAAPTWWSSTTLDFVPPSDIAGVIETGPSVTGDVAAVRIRDLSGRHVSVVGITTRHGKFEDLATGGGAWFFAFAARGTSRDADLRYSHPTNFREAALAQAERRAFGAAILVDSSGTTP